MSKRKKTKETTTKSTRQKLTEVNTNYARVAIILLALQTLVSGYLLHRISAVTEAARPPAATAVSYESTLEN